MSVSVKFIPRKESKPKFESLPDGTFFTLPNEGGLFFKCHDSISKRSDGMVVQPIKPEQGFTKAGQFGGFCPKTRVTPVRVWIEAQPMAGGDDE